MDDDFFSEHAPGSPTTSAVSGWTAGSIGGSASSKKRARAKDTPKSEKKHREGSEGLMCIVDGVYPRYCRTRFCQMHKAAYDGMYYQARRPKPGMPDEKETFDKIMASDDTAAAAIADWCKLNPPDRSLARKKNFFNFAEWRESFGTRASSKNLYDEEPMEEREFIKRKEDAGWPADAAKAEWQRLLTSCEVADYEGYRKSVRLWVPLKPKRRKESEKYIDKRAEIGANGLKNPKVGTVQALQQFALNGAPSHADEFFSGRAKGLQHNSSMFGAPDGEESNREAEESDGDLPAGSADGIAGADKGALPEKPTGEAGDTASKRIADFSRMSDQAQAECAKLQRFLTDATECLKIVVSDGPEALPPTKTRVESAVRTAYTDTLRVRWDLAQRILGEVAAPADDPANGDGNVAADSDMKGAEMGDDSGVKKELEDADVGDAGGEDKVGVKDAEVAVAAAAAEGNTQEEKEGTPAPAAGPPAPGAAPGLAEPVAATSGTLATSASSAVIEVLDQTESLVVFAKSIASQLPPMNIDDILPVSALEEKLSKILACETLMALRGVVDAVAANVKALSCVTAGCLKALGDMKRHIMLCKKSTQKELLREKDKVEKASIAKAKETALAEAKKIVEQRAAKMKEAPPLFTIGREGEAFSNVQATTTGEQIKFNEKEWLESPRLVRGLPSTKTYLGTDLMQKVLCNFAGCYKKTRASQEQGLQSNILNPKQGKEVTEEWMSSLGIPSMDIASVSPSFHTQSWLYGFVSGTVKCEVPPSGAGVLRLCVMGESCLVLARVSSLVAGIKTVFNMSKVTYDDLQKRFLNLTKNEVDLLAKSGCDIFSVNLAQDGILWVPPGYFVAERILQTPLNYGVRKSFLVDSPKVKEDYEALVALRTASDNKVPERMQKLVDLFSCT